MSNDLCSPFNCNICLLLKTRPGKDQNAVQHLLTCSGCQLIKYCTIQHQKFDWTIHKKFCQAVQKIKTSLKITHPFHICGLPKNKQDVEKAVIQIKYLLKNILNRSLEYQEEELSSFPVFCGQCFKFKSLKVTCTKCNSQLYCSEQHKELHKEKHEQVCGLLQLYYCPYKVQTSTEECNMQFGNRVNDLHKMDLYTCIENIFSTQLPNNPCKNLQTYLMFSWAADFSCIMTVCYAMELVELPKLQASNLCIFILGASMEAVLWFREVHCKMFFLQNPQVKVLELYFIGPEAIQPNYKELIFTFLGSERCVKFNIFRGLFQDCKKSIKARPCLLMAFNCGFSEFSQCHNLTASKSRLDAAQSLNASEKHLNTNDTWFEGLVEIVQTLDTPIVFTSFTEQESAFDLAAVHKAVKKQRLKVHIDGILKTTKNPFHDLRPLRQWYSTDQEEFYFRNGYIQAIRTTLEK